MVQRLVDLADRALFRILHICKWLPILWNDHDWDCGYLYIVIRHKLKLMRESHEKNRIIGDWAKVAHEIKIAELCLDRLIKNEYIDKDWEEHEKKYGSFLERRKWVSSPDGTYMRMETEYSPECSADVRRIAKREEALKRQDLETFAKMFVKYSRGWWD